MKFKTLTEMKWGGWHLFCKMHVFVDKCLSIFENKTKTYMECFFTVVYDPTFIKTYAMEVLYMRFKCTEKNNSINTCVIKKRLICNIIIHFIYTTCTV